jgi:membrane fusion protein, heavy metal efflux system
MKQLLPIALLTLAACSRETPAPATVPASAPASSVLIEIPTDSPKLQQITLTSVELAEMPTEEFTAPGHIEHNPNRLSKVVLPYPGRITEVKIAFGDTVKKDQPLLLLQSPEADAAAAANLAAQANVSQNTALLNKAESDLSRVQDLFKGDAIARKELTAAEVAVAQARIQLNQAKNEVQQTNARLQALGIAPGSFRQNIIVRAPLSGKITEINVVAGEFRNDLSAPLLSIADLSDVWVSADVPESAIRLVKIGEAFDVSLNAYPGEVFHSRVTRIADSVNPETRTIEVWAELPNPAGRFRPEMFGQVRHIESFHKVPTVPTTAVIQTQGKTIAFRELSPGKFQSTPITIGKRSGDRIPVLSGLNAGDRVVIDGAMLLRGF